MHRCFWMLPRCLGFSFHSACRECRERTCDFRHCVVTVDFTTISARVNQSLAANVKRQRRGSFLEQDLAGDTKIDQTEMSRGKSEQRRSERVRYAYRLTIRG